MSDPTVPVDGPDRAAALEALLRQPQRRRPIFRPPSWGSPRHALEHDEGDGPSPAGGDAAFVDVGAHPTVDEVVEPVRRSGRRPVDVDPWPRWAGAPGWWPLELPGWSAVVGAVALVVVLVVAWPLLRRPAPADAALPRAGDDPATAVDAVGASAAPSAQPTGAVDAAAPAAPGTGSATGGTTVGGAASGPVTVHVAGAVAAPGVVTLPGGSRVVDAVAAAGGLRPDAESDRVNLAAPVLDGQRVFVPVLGQPVPPEQGAAAVATGSGGPGGDGGSAPAPVDLNAADAAALEELPGVGPATAAAILGHRERNGAFRSVEDLLEVRGIGEAKLDALRDLVVVGR